ncbi:MAG: nuclear transport factor 2 family protein [Chloroflexi bacterium]|nr:nuclear transport factor 2 family protein [Chloroflexota bacterium]MCY3589268.1 nuclear transport factor 2 family protein [Chloroflexota bacterium]MCY3684627.1 nuclear transport factor 2 family protein [Chloroflexota bacterium]MDE2709084.1 nuclear transport factor 2 family protein [Chloroflexota bacterium]MXV81183.1 nuclear transport factor 2 family protein [Chloroflexota bacterium]
MSKISLEDRFAIIDLCSVYNYTVDQADGEGWAATFTEDGVFAGPAGQAEGREALVAFCGQLAEAFPGGMHFTDNHLFEIDGDTCQHKCFLDFKVPSPDGSVASVLLGYEDVVVKVDGEWLFQRRDVVSVTGYQQSLPD